MELSVLYDAIDSLKELFYFVDNTSCDLKRQKFFEWIHNYGPELTYKGIYLYSGATKCVIDVDGCDYVIKFDIEQQTSFCKRECENYSRIKKAHLEKFFVETKFFTTAYNRDFYIQKRVEVDEYEISDRIYTSVSEDYLNDGLDSYDLEDVVCCAIEDFDDEDRLRIIYEGSCQLESLIGFIYDYSINDLHEGNFGIDSNSNIVIFDYSGY